MFKKKIQIGLAFMVTGIIIKGCFGCGNPVGPSVPTRQFKQAGDFQHPGDARTYYIWHHDGTVGAYYPPSTALSTIGGELRGWLDTWNGTTPQGESNGQAEPPNRFDPVLGQVARIRNRGDQPVLVPWQWNGNFRMSLFGQPNVNSFRAGDRLNVYALNQPMIWNPLQPKYASTAGGGIAIVDDPTDYGVRHKKLELALN